MHSPQTLYRPSPTTLGERLAGTFGLKKRNPHAALNIPALVFSTFRQPRSATRISTTPLAARGFALLVTLCLSSPALAESRTWTDSTGKYKIEAEFVEVKDGNARLRRPDGRIINLPLAKLSARDRSAIRDLLKAGQGDPNNPFEAGLESENGTRKRSTGRGRGEAGFMGLRVGDRVEVARGTEWIPGTLADLSTGAAGRFLGVRLDGSDDVDTVIASENFIRRLQGRDPGAPGGRLAEISSDFPVSPANLTRVRRIVPLAAPGAFTADPAPAASAAGRPQPIGLGPKRGFFEKTAALAFSSPEANKCVVVSTGGRGATDEPSRIELCNLKTGAADEGFSAPKNTQLAALSPNGKRLLTVSEVETFTFGPLQAWELTADKLAHVKSWHASSDQRHRKLMWIAWLDDERAFTLDENAVTLWNVDSAQAIYQINVERAESVAFSPGRKQMAVVAAKGVAVYAASDGELLARIALHNFGHNRQVAFSPSGKALAISGQEQVAIFDLATGKKITSVFAQSANAFAKDLAWVSEEHVLVGGSDLIHAPSQMVVWTYEHDADRVAPFGGRMWYFFDDRRSEQRALVPFPLPHRDATQVKDDQLVLKPGDKVGLELELIVDLNQAGNENNASASELLHRALEEAGYQVVDNAPNKLIARTSPGETQEMDYRTFGFRGESHKVNVTGRVYELQLMARNEVVWQRRGVQSAPHHLTLNKDESIDQAIARVMQPNANFFGSSVPSRVLAPSQAENRKSRLSMNGLE